MKRLEDCRLYAFIDTAYLNGRPPERVAHELCEGGADLIQLRAKEIPAADVLRVAREVIHVTSRANVGLVINDFVDVALEVGAQFCHLGQEDFFESGYSHRSELIPADSSLKLGLSSHAPEQAKRAERAGADYVAVGPVFATPTKPSAQPVTLDYVRWAAENLTVPWFAIGGINLENVGEVLAAGASRICVVSAFLNAPDIAAACKDFRKQLASAT